MQQTHHLIPQYLTAKSPKISFPVQESTTICEQSSSNNQPDTSRISIKIPQTRTVQISLSARKLKTEGDVPVVTNKLPSKPEGPKKRIIFTKVSKDSDIEFGMLSECRNVVTPLERIKRSDLNQSPSSKISPKHALLYREDGFDLLGSKFQRATRDPSCHSLEEIGNDIDDFGNEKVHPIRIPKPRARGPTHRRKSCVCSWCGGASNLEKAIQNHPSIPATVCLGHLESRRITTEACNTPTSCASRKSSVRSRLNVSRNPKKSIFGQHLSMVMDSTPKFTVRKSIRTKTSIFGADKETNPLNLRPIGTRQKSLPKIMKSIKSMKTTTQIEVEDEDSDKSNGSINLEEEPSSKSSSKKTLTMLTSRKPTLLNLKQVPSIQDIYIVKQVSGIGKSLKELAKKGTMIEIKETEQTPKHEDDKEEQEEDQLEEEAKNTPNIFRIKKRKTRKIKKMQKSLALPIEKIKNSYSSACTSPKAATIFLKPQTPTMASSMFIRTKTTSISSWGFESPKMCSSPMEKSSRNEKRFKTEAPQTPVVSGQAMLQQKLSFAQQMVERQQTASQISFNLKSARPMNASCQIPVIKNLNSPKSSRTKTIFEKQRAASISQPDKYIIAV